ncbi:hypothetical protein DV702_14255 [Sporosarcina sp. PTS2304]|uniref:spr1630 family ClpXP-sensitive toxin n=1 Tax=Sporosarcina sp. PTS2304 TaxID=2283194 RepID=UPI000E0D9E91|nr:hypothetical protein [Sporosarcina sp. PTS2304]AXI00763.1 hypothetical protein DV702_14255 [Sporosarcina sp. PTS2304]
MENYNLPEQLNESIVDGIIEGYRDYLEVRRQKARELEVHGAYAWVKGNHIDHYVAQACKEHGVKSSVAKAGMTWQYLQFFNKDEKILFVVKNSRYFNLDDVDKGKDAKGIARTKRSTYMTNLMDINSRLNFNEVPANYTRQSIQLELLEDFQPIILKDEDTKGMHTEFDKFYIATYTIDEDYRIGEIRIWLPNPANNKAYLISDLTSYIGTKPSHQFEIEDDLKDVLTQTIAAEGIVDAAAFGIVIDGAEEQQS